MSPDELREAADQLTRYVGRIPGSPNDPDYLNAWDLAEAAVRLADVIEYAERERARVPSVSRIDRSAPEVLGSVLRIARGETTNEEKR